MEKFGKSAAAILRLKNDFFTHNEQHCEEQERVASIYKAQPRRKNCKNCLSNLGPVDFSKLGIDYHICSTCGHLNGAHEDTWEFAKAVYAVDGGAEYAKGYDSEDKEKYKTRVKEIYVPKAKFLQEALLEKKQNLADIPCLDIGAGSGYFVAALNELGIKSVAGIEVSNVQVNLGNQMMGKPLLQAIDIERTNEFVANTQSKLVSLVGVLEHIANPWDVLHAIEKNKNIDFVFMSLPMFSSSVMVELNFPKVMHRNLSGGHTHLYTDSSIAWFTKKIGFHRAAEWWFGTDMVDLFRSLQVGAKQLGASEAFVDGWGKDFVEAIDDMQFALDKRKLSSELHFLLQRN